MCSWLWKINVASFQQPNTKYGKARRKGEMQTHKYKRYKRCKYNKKLLSKVSATERTQKMLVGYTFSLCLSVASHPPPPHISVSAHMGSFMSQKSQLSLKVTNHFLNGLLPLGGQTSQVCGSLQILAKLAKNPNIKWTRLTNGNREKGHHSSFEPFRKGQQESQNQIHKSDSTQYI